MPSARDGNPAAVDQRLEVPADGGLRQLHDGAQLGDRQLVAVEQQQQAAARGVGERREVVEDGRGAG